MQKKVTARSPIGPAGEVNRCSEDTGAESSERTGSGAAMRSERSKAARMTDANSVSVWRPGCGEVNDECLNS